MRVLFVLGFVIVFCTAQGQSYFGDSWERVREQQKGAITLVFVETPALAFKNSAGVFSGISVDIMNDFVEYIHTTHHIILEINTVGEGTNFKGMYDSVRNASGGVFGLGNITITEERKKEVRFSPPYISSFSTLVTQNNVAMLTRLEDLPRTFANFTGYTPRGTLNEKRMAELKQKYFPALKILFTSTGQEAVEKIMTDANGFAYLDFVFYLQALQAGRPVRRHAVGDRPSEQFGFITPLNSDWSPLLEEFFAANGGYRNSPQYQDILRRHLGDTGVRLLQGVR